MRASPDLDPNTRVWVVSTCVEGVGMGVVLSAAGRRVFMRDPILFKVTKYLYEYDMLPLCYPFAPPPPTHTNHHSTRRRSPHHVFLGIPFQ